MDETYDRIRGVPRPRFHYIRNFHPEWPYAQIISYGELMPTMQEWRRLHAEGRLDPIQDAFFAPTKPAEELYDTEADPDEVHNLAGDPALEKILVAMRAALTAGWTRPATWGASPRRS